MNIKYQILLNILDELCFEAPENYKSYWDNSSNESINAARSKSYIHLFLMVKFGITDFGQRHDIITDGSRDGGLDAYYIDETNKLIYLIQSKFRTKDSNFEEKSITSDDLVKMDLKLILKGSKKDSYGNEFNSKIKEFQKKLTFIQSMPLYNCKVIILGNLTKYNDNQIKRLIENFDYEIFDFQRTYNELCYPICSGTLFEPKEININIDLYKKIQVNLDQDIETSFGSCGVMLVFVPTIEIGRIMSKYKNALLKYNPRNYLSLSKNKVNSSISDSIVKGSNNDFSILNNGITIIADNIKISTERGSETEGQLLLHNPQIINGGQTAYTLSNIYEDKRINNKCFERKEVLLRIVRMENSSNNHIEFLKKISDSTNSQTKVDEADKRSNDEIQTEIQKKIYKEYGYFYERKAGEFYNGKEKKFISNDLIIDRSKFLRSYNAFKGNAKDSRNLGDDQLFKITNFEKIMGSSNHYKDMFFAYKLYKISMQLRRKSNKRLQSSLKYGKYALISAIGHSIYNKQITKSEFDDSNIEKICKNVLKKWLRFERIIVKKRSNKQYKLNRGFDFDNYYKGSTIDEDLKSFFRK